MKKLATLNDLGKLAARSSANIEEGVTMSDEHIH